MIMVLSRCTGTEMTSEKYGHYCKAIAKNILNNEEDADECVNDTYFNAWNAMPTHWPEQLATFLGKITLVLDELADCVSDMDDVEKIIDLQELTKAINSFIKSFPTEKCNIFVWRYWYAESMRIFQRQKKTVRPNL